MANKFETDCLAEHNKLRAQHGCPPLELDRKLCDFAKEWAMSLAKRDAMEHRPNNKYGENIFKAGGMTIEGNFPVQMWYNEIKEYDFKKPDFSPKTGHFTAVVWKATKKMGVAVVVKDRFTIVVANYDPPGNVMGEFAANVPAKK